MFSFRYSETFHLLAYFLSLIITGTILLLLPYSWNGPGTLSFIDALFTATSAVCVTGLITVDTALYSRIGQIIILVLIQCGGLGLISFSTLYLVIPSNKMSFKGQKIIKEYYIDTIEYEPSRIIKQILLLTLIIEAAGVLFLYTGFKNTKGADALFYSIFHSVSAFCNAGFSLFSNNLENYTTNGMVNITVICLIVTGGIGFVVIRDIVKKLSRHKKHFSLHTKIVLLMTILLIIISSSLILFIEYHHSLRAYDLKNKIMISLFHSVTPRTAGFNTIVIAKMNLLSQLVLLTLMFIGGAPGSISGGIKVTTFFIIILILIKKLDYKNSITIFKRKLSSNTIVKAMVFLIKVTVFLLLSIFLLTLSEYIIKPGQNFNIFSIIFECFSAFGTVGLSLGITSSLSFPGKMIIIMTMLLGRAGIMIILINIFEKKNKTNIEYPEEEVLIS